MRIAVRDICAPSQNLLVDINRLSNNTRLIVRRHTKQLSQEKVLLADHINISTKQIYDINLHRGTAYGPFQMFTQATGLALAIHP